jgi:hypothetical protein
MTIQEILNAHKGYTEREINGWRRARWLGAIIANVYSKDPIKPSRLLPLPGDDAAPNYADDIKELKEKRKKKA